jgi:hypothetical protein
MKHKKANEIFIEGIDVLNRQWIQKSKLLE